MRKNAINIKFNPWWKSGFLLMTFLFTLSMYGVPGKKDKKKKIREPEINLLENQILDSNLRTVEMYLSGGAGDVIDDPIKSLDNLSPIVLEFDWLGEVVPYMNARVVHCDYDWEQSTLNEVDFIQNINEYQLSDVEQSSNTFVPYNHIRFELPNTIISGNFVLQVYSEDDPDVVYISRRFIIFQNLVLLKSKLSYSSVVSERNKNHQLDFSLSYGNIDVTNPGNAFQIAILQNGRWDNAITDLIPTAIREDQKMLKYDFFSGENNFVAGNEFRAIDLRSSKNEGLGVEKIDMKPIPRLYKLYDDTPKRGFAYSDSRDMQGKFVISNFRGSDKINSDYVHVDFTLKSTTYEKPIYIFGGLSDWKLKPEFEMSYDSVSKVYSRRVLLKQGYYNYLYALNKDEQADIATIDGSHQQTTNKYVVLVYLRRFGFYNDEVVGYSVVK